MNGNAHPGRWLRWPDEGRDGHPHGLGFGADYNPEQWPPEVWDEDVRLMQTAGVNIVSLAIFSWSYLQPSPDEWTFEWLDEIMDLLHRHGIAVDLATATASPPPWLTTAHPEILPINERGETIWPGARQHWRPTSPIFRQHALQLVERMAARYADHPALVAWHVSNELGCHNVFDFSDDAARAFRVWLQGRYESIDGLNSAWATAFWSQRYSHWEQVLPPRLAAAHVNPTQQLDFRRFSSNALKEYLQAEREVLVRLAPATPITTNFMVMGHTKAMNYPDWTDAVDFVSNDHYRVVGTRELDELSFSANLTSGIAKGQPWFLMEHSTSAVNWQKVNLPKRKGELARDALTHVAHGADAVCFFQWRQSAAGAEKYHSAMVPHAGHESDLFRDVAALGALLEQLAPLVGSTRLPAQVAILFDWESWWASELDSHPSSLLDYHDEVLDWYSRLLDLGIRVDVVPSSAQLTGYRVVVAPQLYAVSADQSERLRGLVESGAHLLTTYFSGIVDLNDHVWPGGYPGAFRDLLGIRIDEFGPLVEHDEVALDNGHTGTLWSDRIEVTGFGVEVLASYATGEYAGRPALTRRRVASGSATYVSTKLTPAAAADVLAELLDVAGVESELPAEVRGSVELAIRHDGEQEFWFIVNRTTAAVHLAGLRADVLAGAALQGTDGLQVPGTGVAVLTRPARR